MVPIIDQLSKKSLEYLGKLQEIQQNPSDHRGKNYGALSLTKYQKLLYQRAVYGLEIYESKELSGMHREKKIRITKIHKKAKVLLNVLKQEKMNQVINGFVGMLCPKSILGSELLSEFRDLIDPDYDIKLTIKDLRIDKRTVVDKFIEEGVLPNNFYELEDNPHGLPQLRQRKDKLSTCV